MWAKRFFIQSQAQRGGEATAIADFDEGMQKALDQHRQGKHAAPGSAGDMPIQSKRGF